MSKEIPEKNLIISTIKAREARQEKRYQELSNELKKLRKDMEAWSDIVHRDLKDSLKAVREANKRQTTANRMCLRLEKLLKEYKEKVDEYKLNDQQWKRIFDKLLNGKDPDKIITDDGYRMDI